MGLSREFVTHSGVVLHQSDNLGKFFCSWRAKTVRVRRIDELGKDNLAELDNTENNGLSAGTKRYVAT